VNLKQVLLECYLCSFQGRETLIRQAEDKSFRNRTVQDQTLHFNAHFQLFPSRTSEGFQHKRDTDVCCPLLLIITSCGQSGNFCYEGEVATGRKEGRKAAAESKS
jgi:hypothetical protein